MGRDLLRHLPLLFAGLVVLLLTWLVSKIVGAIVERSGAKAGFRRSFRDLIRQLAVVTVWLIGLFTAATIIFPDLTVGKVLTLFGLASVAIGFAFKDIFENFFAGVLILWRYPFDEDDFIVCGDISGCVEEIEIRITKIRRTDGILIVVPNAELFKNPVDVLTNLPSRRITIIAGVAYGEDVAESRGVIREAVEGCESVTKDKDVEIFAQEFGSSSINFEVTWWTDPTPLDERRSRDEVVEAVKSALDNAGIEIPFPYRTLTFNEPLPITDKRSGSDEDETSS